MSSTTNSRATIPSAAPRGSRRKLRPSDPKLLVACFGELLWDALPRGIFLGGAPINAAYHLAQQGLAVLPITAVGRDFLGDEARRRIEGWGLDARFIAVRKRWPTGTVRAQLDADGLATYEIARDVAWDHIEAPTALRRRAPIALVYGTLALRNATNRRTLATLLDFWPDALRVVDLNLRAPFDRGTAIALALKNAQLVKLNDDELAQLTGISKGTDGWPAEAAKTFARTHRLARVCVTAGARGAGLWWDGEWFWEHAQPIQVRDTVGAGDAFLGALLGALLVRKLPPQTALVRACRLGEFVASRDGATPAYRLTRDGHPAE